MEEPSSILVSVAEDHMQIRNYEPGVAALASTFGRVEDDRRIINRTELTDNMKKLFGLSKYKCKQIIDVLLETGLFEQGESVNELYVVQLTTNFLKMFVTTVRFCCEHLSTFTFKVYCYLFNKYNMHIYYQYNDNYFFSEKEILESIGYSRNVNIRRRLKESLKILKKLGLIEYSEEAAGRPGKHGVYHELYAVYNYSPIQKNALQELVDEGEKLSPNIVSEAAAMEVEIPKKLEPDKEEMKLFQEFLEFKKWKELHE